MVRHLVLTVAAAALGLLATSRAAADHPNLHRAIYELREAHKELKEARNNFGGHKAKAMEELEAAAAQIEKCLESVGDPYKGYTPPPDAYKNYKNNRHLRHALVDLREARDYLKAAPNKFGGHKAKAVASIESAMVQVENCIKQAK